MSDLGISEKIRSAITQVCKMYTRNMTEHGLKLTRLWNKSNAEFLNEMVFIFSEFYSSETTYVISSFNLRTE